MPGLHGDLSSSESSTPDSQPTALPLEAIRDRAEQGWVVRLRVRGEHVTVSKEVVIRERVFIRRNAVDGVAHVESEVLREELRIDTTGQVAFADSATETGLEDVPYHSEQLAARQGLPWRRDARVPRDGQ